MINTSEDKNFNSLFEDLKIDCKSCFGFCCVALFFSKTDGFPNDKEAGTPCKNLNNDFSCSIHSNLMGKGLKGCTIYDCFGAGQKVAQITYNGKDWRKQKNLSKEMFEVFLIVRSLHEMLWYLNSALKNKATRSIHDDIVKMIKETNALTRLDAKELMKLDVIRHRQKVNGCLLKASELIDKDVSKNNKNKVKGFDFIGKDLRKHNLKGADFKGALLIASNLSNTDLSYANFIGADLRDTDIRGANLSESSFITQIQINSAKGNSKTKLPKHINVPSHWEK